MRATGFTHVSIGARDVEESARFYKDFFGMEEVPAPEFSGPVRWLRVGGLQLHLFHDEGPAPVGHHFALDVDDFEEAFRRAAEAGTTRPSGSFPTGRCRCTCATRRGTWSRSTGATSARSTGKS
jgi:catechol 2,3-dioxygenase-like lactoylglutathione lyase family enzyme